MVGTRRLRGFPLPRALRFADALDFTAAFLTITFFFLPFFGFFVSASNSWKLSRMHCAKNSGSGNCSRHDVGEMKIIPS